jgi:hypothetical protein
MTWSERQALARKRAEDEEAASRAAAAPSAPSAGSWGAAAAAASIGSAAVVSWEPEPEATPDEEPVVRELPETQLGRFFFEPCTSHRHRHHHLHRLPAVQLKLNLNRNYWLHRRPRRPHRPLQLPLSLRLLFTPRNRRISV